MRPNLSSARDGLVQSPDYGLGFSELLSEERYYVESFWHAGQCSAPGLEGGSPRTKWAAPEQS